MTTRVDDDQSGPATSEAMRHVLAPSVAQIPEARRFVVDAAHRLGCPLRVDAVDDLALLASEAITNAVEHGGTEVEVTVELLAHAVRVRVHDDDGGEIPTASAMPAGEVGTGRGLAIIDAVAGRWGIDVIEGDGKTLWFEVTVDPSDERAGATST